MVKIRVTDAGIIQEPGSGFEGAPTSVSVGTKTATSTLTAGDAGLTILSASQGALTITLPAVADAPGAMFIFRSTSPSAHIVSSSLDAGNRISVGAGTITAADLVRSGTNASRITFPTLAGTSVALMSDGVSWLVLGGSGSMTFAKGV